MSISILVYSSLSVPSDRIYNIQFLESLNKNKSGYSQTVNSQGGYDVAKFNIYGDKSYLDDWFSKGLMRRIVVIDDTATVIWEGFVNQLLYSFGDTQKTKTIETMYNRVYNHYSPLDTSVSPPVAGDPITLIMDNVDSQYYWGVKSIVISGGERVDNTVYNWTRKVLDNRADIPKGEAINTGQQNEPSIEVSCKGYYHALKWLPYIASGTGTSSHDTIIKAVITYFNTINNWFSSDYTQVDYNYQKSGVRYDELISCWDVIANLTREGGLGGESWVAGIYQDRRLIYKPAEDLAGLYGSEPTYYRYLNDPNKMIYNTVTGTEVKPWNILPDRILKTIDQFDSEDLYIEAVTFTEPYNYQIVGGDDNRLETYLAQKGLPTI